MKILTETELSKMMEWAEQLLKERDYICENDKENAHMYAGKYLVEYLHLREFFLNRK